MNFFNYKSANKQPTTSGYFDVTHGSKLFM